MTTDDQGAADDNVMRCSFCNKTQFELRKLVSGPGVAICDECISICVDITSDDRTAQAPPSEHAKPIGWPSTVYCSLCRMPVTREDTLPVEDRGLVCRPCVVSVQSAASRRVDR